MAKPERQAEFVRWFGPLLTASIASVSTGARACGASVIQHAGTWVDAEAPPTPEPILDWGGEAVGRYAETRPALEQARHRIGGRDLFIAAHALASDWTS